MLSGVESPAAPPPRRLLQSQRQAVTQVPRAARPTAEITELLHAERMVECFEAEMWSTCSDNAMFRSTLNAACSQSKILSPRLSDEEIGDIRTELRHTLEAWRELSVGESLILRY